MEGFINEALPRDSEPCVICGKKGEQHHSVTYARTEDTHHVYFWTCGEHAKEGKLRQYALQRMADRELLTWSLEGDQVTFFVPDDGTFEYPEELYGFEVRITRLPWPIEFGSEDK